MLTELSSREVMKSSFATGASFSGLIVTVTVSARWRDEHREAVQELERGELEHALSVGAGLWQLVAQTLALAHPRQPNACENRAGAVAQQAFESDTVLGLNPNAGIEREP